MTKTAHDAVTASDARTGDIEWQPMEARFPHWRLFAGMAALAVVLAWLSMPHTPHHELNVRLATFAFRV
jgi:hypothetical protein